MAVLGCGLHSKTHERVCLRRRIKLFIEIWGFNIHNKTKCLTIVRFATQDLSKSERFRVKKKGFTSPISLFTYQKLQKYNELSYRSEVSNIRLDRKVNLLFAKKKKLFKKAHKYSHISKTIKM